MRLEREAVALCLAHRCSPSSFIPPWKRGDCNWVGKPCRLLCTAPRLGGPRRIGKSGLRLIGSVAGSILSRNYQPEGQASERPCLGVRVDLIAHVVNHPVQVLRFYYAELWQELSWIPAETLQSEPAASWEMHQAAGVLGLPGRKLGVSRGGDLGTAAGRRPEKQGESYHHFNDGLLPPAGRWAAVQHSAKEPRGSLDPHQNTVISVVAYALNPGTSQSCRYS